MIAIMKIRLAALVIVPLAALVSGCATNTLDDMVRHATPPVTTASLPSSVKPLPRVEETLACIRDTHALRGVTFVVGPFADSTGKINATAQGATGNFIPQGGSAAYITDAIRKAGGTIVSTYFGQPARKTHTTYAINGIFNSLDFGQPFAADVRVAGIGPLAGVGWAQLTLSIQLDQSETRVNKQISMIQRPVRYTQVGVGTGHDFGGTLVTGTVAFQNQERLQFEALNGPIALGVADVILREFPKARDACSAQVADLLKI
jgi:hypothetical protein